MTSLSPKTADVAVVVVIMWLLKRVEVATKVKEGKVDAVDEDPTYGSSK